MSRLVSSLVLLMVSAIWGLTFVVQKWAVTGNGAIGPLTFTGIRFLLGALTVLPFAWRESRRAPNVLSTRHWLGFVGCGLAVLLGSWTQQVGLGETTVGHAGFLTAIYVALVPLFSWGLFGRRPHWVLYPAIGICLTGIWLLTGIVGWTGLSHGDEWVLCGALFWALQITLLGIVAAESHRPLTLACTQFVVTGLLATLAGLVFESPSMALILGASRVLLWGGVVSAGFAFTLQVVAQRYLHPAPAALIMSSEMVFAALGGAWAFGEHLSLSQLLGAALILLAILAVELVPLLMREKVGVINIFNTGLDVESPEN